MSVYTRLGNKAQPSSEQTYRVISNHVQCFTIVSFTCELIASINHCNLEAEFPPVASTGGAHTVWKFWLQAIPPDTCCWACVVAVCCIPRALVSPYAWAAFTLAWTCVWLSQLYNCSCSNIWCVKCCLCLCLLHVDPRGSWRGGSRGRGGGDRGGSNSVHPRSRFEDDDGGMSLGPPGPQYGAPRGGRGRRRLWVHWVYYCSEVGSSHIPLAFPWDYKGCWHWLTVSILCLALPHSSLVKQTTQKGGLAHLLNIVINWEVLVYLVTLHATYSSLTCMHITRWEHLADVLRSSA